jgi:hypothetical protein
MIIPIIDLASETEFVMSTAKRLLADIRELGPDIGARVAEIEAGRRISRPRRCKGDCECN